MCGETGRGETRERVFGEDMDEGGGEDDAGCERFMTEKKRSFSGRRMGRCGREWGGARRRTRRRDCTTARDLRASDCLASSRASSYWWCMELYAMEGRVEEYEEKE
ncbi:hypothetical protein KSP39_PZI020432 [Platanthera zijinensis]|uniref:Uncharacterized protein n=1 Tax=Platanthera zijinensis TaxID=2320716 RepID=A0AAP0B0B1_9ASPA